MKTNKEEKTFGSELKERVFGVKDVNPFWRKMQLAGAIFAGIGTIIVAAPFGLPVALIAAGKYAITIGGTITGIAQLTKK